MPTNLPPEAVGAEKRYRAADTLEDKITTLEEYIGAIPKHKGTDHLRADLRKKLAKLKDSAQTRKGTGRQVSAFHIDREGGGQVVLLGLPNVGKSALVATLTNANPEVADYPYTTWGPTPGMMLVENIPIQLIDTPPLSKEFVDPEMLNLVRRADLVLLIVDLQGFPLQQIEDTVAILEKNRIVAAHHRDRYEAERRLAAVPILILANKCDDERCEQDFEVLCELLEGEWTVLPASATTGNHLEAMKWAVVQQLDIIRVYSKAPGQEPKFHSPFLLKRGGTVAEFARKVHLDFYENLKAARVWGSTTFEGQMVERDYALQDGDVVELRI
jgi:ribosome-interacting GTPase 1